MAHDSLLIGHRGSSRDTPENTLAAFNRAWEEGADGIEADFRLTRDGEIVCMHDASTMRTAGVDFAIADSTLAELRLLDVGRWKGAAWEGSVIPTLAEVLAGLPPAKKLYLELKSGAEIIPYLEHVLVTSRVCPEQIRILAFSASLIAGVKQQLPAYRACWLTDYRRDLCHGGWLPSQEEVLATLDDTGVDGLASRARAILDDDFARKLRSTGMEIHVWTVDTPGSARRFRELGVDSIMTNRPGWLRQKLTPLARVS